MVAVLSTGEASLRAPSGSAVPKRPVRTHKLVGQFVKQVASCFARMPACGSASKTGLGAKLGEEAEPVSGTRNESSIFPIRACATGRTWLCKAPLLREAATMLRIALPALLRHSSILQKGQL